MIVMRQPGLPFLPPRSVAPPKILLHPLRFQPYLPRPLPASPVSPGRTERCALTSSMRVQQLMGLFPTLAHLAGLVGVREAAVRPRGRRKSFGAQTVAPHRQRRRPHQRPICLRLLTPLQRSQVHVGNLIKDSCLNATPPHRHCAPYHIATPPLRTIPHRHCAPYHTAIAHC